MRWAGASKEIREAISNQTAESELQAWNTVLPLVLKVKSFVNFRTRTEFLSRFLNFIQELILN